MFDREWLLGVARAEREALGRTIQYTPPDRWDAEGPFEGTRVRDVASLLAAWEAVAAATIAGEPAAELEEHRAGLDPGAPFRREAFEAAAVARRAEQHVVAVALEWGQAADRFLVHASKIDEEEWPTRDVEWLGEAIGARFLVQSRVAEWWLRGEDIRTGAGLPPRREHWPVVALNDLAIRLLPHSLSAAGHDLSGSLVRVELEAVGGGEWTQPLGRGDAGKRRPDAIIRGRGPTFALIAGGRFDVEVALYDGLVNLGGDVEVGQAVLRSLRSSI